MRKTARALQKRVDERCCKLLACYAIINATHSYCTFIMRCIIVQIVIKTNHVIFNFYSSYALLSIPFPVLIPLRCITVKAVVFYCLNII